MGDYKSPGFIGRTFFLRRISNPSGRLTGDGISNPPGRLTEDRNTPLGVSTDLQSVVKKCPNLFMLWGFAIPSNQIRLICYWGITNPPVS